MRFHKIANVNKALDFIASKGVKLVSIGAEGEKGTGGAWGRTQGNQEASPMRPSGENYSSLSKANVRQMPGNTWRLTGVQRIILKQH